MRFKTTAILIALLFILILIAYLFERGAVKEKQAALTKGPIFSDFKAEQAATIEVKRKGKPFSFNQKEGRWIVVCDGNSYPADKEEIENIFTTVKGMHRENIVSTDPAKYSVFEVDKENGIEVKLSKADNSPIAHFFVGKNGPDLFSTYIRVEGEKEVFLLGGIINAAFLKELKDWRDKSIFKLNAKDIVRVSITAQKKKLSLATDEKGNWELVEPEKAKVKKDAVEGMLNPLATLRAYDFEDGADLKAAALINPSTRIQIVMKDNSTFELLIGKDKDTSKKYVKREDNPTVFLVQNYDLMPILKDASELKEGR